jgi:phosphinothricin acetyltransferase
MEPGSVRIRPATTEDAAALAAIYAPIVESSPASFEIEPPTVGEKARGRGIGGALLDELLRRLRDAGFATVRAGTTLPNDASVRLFESRGFTPVGIFERTGYKLGAWHDVGWWQLILSDEPGPLPDPASP